MALRARYDPREDRMFLALQFPEQPEQRYWVTRRLWLALYGQIASLAPSQPEQALPPPPANPPRPMAAGDTADAVALDGVRIKKNEDGVRLVFASARGNTFVDFKQPGLLQLKRLLEMQAERAGWDAAAALERLQADAIAGATVRRAKS
jgi:hypothetical protein